MVDFLQRFRLPSSRIQTARFGFTLIEVLVVIAIVGILAAAVVIAINPLKRIAQAHDAQRKSNLGSIARALQVYYAEKLFYPDPGPALQADSTEGIDWIPGLRPDYLKNLPKDPKQAGLPSYSAFGGFLEKLGGKVSDIFAAGNSYYVDTNHPSANDANPGTEASPWKTIQKAANTLVAGDTVYIKAGTYAGLVSPANSGNAGAWITYSAYPGHQAILGGNGFVINGKNYIKVSGFRIQNVPAGNNEGVGISIKGPSSNIIISGNYTYDTQSSGIRAFGVPWLTDPATCSYQCITNLIIENNTVDNCVSLLTGYNECITLFGGVDTFEIRGNTVKNGNPSSPGGEGIDVKEGASNGKIYQNHIFNFKKIAIYIDAAGTLAYPAPWLRNIEVFGNYIHDVTNGGLGIAMVSEGKGSIDGIKVYNNIIHTTDRGGILIYKHFQEQPEAVIKNITIVNNTTYNNGLEAGHSGGGIQVNHPDVQNVVVRNNIAYRNDVDIIFNASGAGNVEDHNLTTNPLFVNEAALDFHLLSGSGAINTGSSVMAPSTDYDGNTRPIGADFDIGAYEYGGVPPSPEPSPGGSPEPSPSPGGSPAPSVFKYLYIVTSDLQSFTLWAQLENLDDNQIYDKPGAPCPRVPPALTSYNYCVGL